MKKIVLVVIAAILMLTCAVRADVIPLNYPMPDRLALAICHDGGEGIRDVTIINGWNENLKVITTTTGIPYKWADGPVVPKEVSIPLWVWQKFQVRVSSEDINGVVWPVGNYTGKIVFSIDGQNVPVPVRLWIAECDDGPPEYPVPELPVSSRLPVPSISAAIVLAMFVIVMVIRWKKQ